MDKFNEELIENTGIKDIPDWLNDQLFEDILKRDFPHYQKTTKFIVRPAVKTGENFMTIMLRVTIEFEEKSNVIKNKTSYMVKIKPAPERLQFMIKEWKIFLKEHTTYSKYITAFEKYYRNVGSNIKLAPRLLEPSKNIDDDVLILEDLRLKGFENFNRHLGLDLEHTKAVLKKLAQFHAASAHHFLKAGPYMEIFNKCLPTDVDLHEDHRNNINRIFLENLHLYGDFQYMKEKLKNFSETQPDPFQLASDWKINKFNVLNHGDCWTNNIMFQYNQNGKITETLLIDFQTSRYGSPAQDLYYFLLSSTNFEIKLKYFDYFIFYYHQQLKTHLELLQYEGEIPQLRDLHLELYKHDYWVYITISALMPVLLCESREDANVDNLLDGDNDEFKTAMYTNDLYIKNMNILLPWLDQRGAFDI